MSIEAAKIVIRIDTDAPQATREMRSLDSATTDAAGAAGQARRGFDALKSVGIAAFAAVAAREIAKVGISLIGAASDAEETLNKFNVTFQGINTEAEATAQNLADSFGLAQTEARGLLANTGDLLTGFGFTRDRALQLSTQVQELAVDLASFTNFSGGAAGASEALTKALLGERESIKSLGIAITEADIARLAEERGITGELDRQTKAALTLELAIQQSGNAIGDFARSSDSFANQQRIAEAAVQDLREELGQQLLPIATDMVGLFTDAVKWFSNLDNGVKEIIITFGAVVGVVASVVAGVNALKVAMLALSANPITLVIAGLAGLATVAVRVIGNIETMDDRINELPASMESYRGSIEDILGPMEDLSELEELGPERYQRLVEMYPELAGEIDEYGTSVQAAADEVARLAREEARSLGLEVFGKWAEASERAQLAVRRQRELEESLAEAEAAIAAGVDPMLARVDLIAPELERQKVATQELTENARELWRTYTQVLDQAVESFQGSRQQIEETTETIEEIPPAAEGAADAIVRIPGELETLKAKASDTAAEVDKLKTSLDGIVSAVDAVGESTAQMVPMVEAAGSTFGAVADQIEAITPKAEEWGEITKTSAEKGSEALDEQREKFELLAQIKEDELIRAQERDAEEYAAWQELVEARNDALMDAAEDEAALRAQARERHQQELQERAEEAAAAREAADARIAAAQEAELREAESWARAQEAAREAYRERVELAYEMVTQIGNLIMGIGDFWSTMYDRQIAAAGDNEEEANRIRRRQARAEKAFAIMQATINTAVAVTKVIANPVLAAIVAAAGAAQIAAIAAMPLPSESSGGGGGAPSAPSVPSGGGYMVPPENGSIGGDFGSVEEDAGPDIGPPSNFRGPDTVVVRLGEREFAAAVEDSFNRGGAQIRRPGAVRVRQ